MKSSFRLAFVSCTLALSAACSAADEPAAPSGSDEQSLSQANLARGADGDRPGASRGRGNRGPRGENPCAAVSCLEGNTCEVIDGEGVCVPIEENPCAAVSCLVGDECQVIDGEGVCVPGGGGGGITCASVLCIIGSVCEETPEGPVCVPFENPCNLVDCAPGNVCEVQNGEPVCIDANAAACAAVSCLAGTSCEVIDGTPQCVPNEPSGRFCGGFAGIECPGAGSCVDDPTDDCDPNDGGADCGGLCECSGALVLCAPGTVFDEDPNVCACVEEPITDPCAAVRCAGGTHCEVIDGSAACVDDGLTNPCAAVLCPVDTTCDVVDGEAVCTPVDASACAAVLCPTDTHCVVRNGEPRCQPITPGCHASH